MLAGDERTGEVELIAVGGGGGLDLVEEVLLRVTVHRVQRLLRAGTGVEGGGPLGQRVFVVAGGDEGAALRIDPVGGVGGVAGGQDGGAVFERDTEDFGLADGGEAQLIAKRGGALIARRCAHLVPRVEEADDVVALVLDGCDLVRFAAAEIPPLVGVDAMAVGIGAGAERGVAGRGLGVGVVVVAVGEVGAVVEEEPEAVRSRQVGAIALEVVLAKLIDDNEDDELRFAVVCGGVRRDGRKRYEQ
jgi:hypothetical protein